MIKRKDNENKVSWKNFKASKYMDWLAQAPSTISGKKVLWPTTFKEYN